MHLLDTKVVVFFCLAASLAFAQPPADTDEHLDARDLATATATANGALDLSALDSPANDLPANDLPGNAPLGKVETLEHREREILSGEPDSSTVSSSTPDDSTAHTTARHTAPMAMTMTVEVPASAEPTNAEKERMASVTPVVSPVASPVATSAVTPVATLVVAPEVTATVTETVPSQNTRSIVPKGRGRGQRLVRDTTASVPWYRTPYVTLLVVLGLIVAASVAFKRWVPAARQVSPDTMRVLGRVALATKHSAVLLHVGRRVVLVGLSADTVSTLAEIRDVDEVAALLGQSAQAKVAAGFEKTLAKEINAYPEDPERQDDITPVDEELLAKTQGQLHGLLSKLRAMQSTPVA